MESKISKKEGVEIGVISTVNREFLTKRRKNFKGNSYETAYMEAASKLFSSYARMSLTSEEEETIIRIANKL